MKESPDPHLVLVTVVHVRVVRMTVRQRLVPVPMAVRFAARIVRAMGVLMVHVVMMQMLMLHRLVCVLVLVPLVEMKPDAH